MPVLDRPCGRISYQVSGSGSPAVLLSHGFAATSAMFAANMPAIAASHEVIAWDLRGHGGSDYPADPESYRPAEALADMAALLTHCGRDRAVLGGHSLGGYLSLDFALAFPDRVAALILIDTGPGFRNEAARDRWNGRAAGTADRLAQRGLGAIGSGAELHANEHRDASGLALAARHTLTQRDSHVLDGLAAIAVPTLVIVGADDEPFLGAADYMTAKIPMARKIVIPDAGHAPNVDKPELFDSAVIEFLAEITTAEGEA
ncbi:MAG TPA: alpha/beta fold hydrolase [Streptosporangiaceae bacterium]|nr:alpha/beta fold hydrolase [Streptosporangiaceae bacterium]